MFVFYGIIDIFLYLWLEECLIKRITTYLKLFLDAIDRTIYSWPLAIFFLWLAHKTLVKFLFIFSADTILKWRLSSVNGIFLERFTYIIAKSSIIERFIHFCLWSRFYSLWISIYTCKDGRSLIMASILLVSIFMNIFFPWFFFRFFTRFFFSTFS